MDYAKIAEDVASKLEGTTQGLETVLEQMELDGLENVLAFCDRLDNLVFCCTVCGWWFEVSETGNDVNGQWACVECGGEIED